MEQKTKNGRRVAILLSHPIHYLVALYTELSRDPNTEVTVYFCSDFGIREGYDATFGKAVRWYSPNLLQNLPHVFLKNYSPAHTIAGFWSVINPGIIPALKRGNYDAVIIHSYAQCTSWLALFAAKWHGIPVLFRGEANALRHTPPLKAWLKKNALTIFFRRISAYLAIGQLSAKYYASFGVPDEKIFSSPYAVNNSMLQSEHAKLTGKKAAIKKELGLPEELPVILFAGKLIPRKDPGILLRAFRALSSHATLVYAGDGPEMKSLRHFAKEQNIPHVYFFGFQPPEALTRFYAIADIFALPTRYETWGLAVNEAMNFGLPVITTDMAGSAYDLVQNGKNGFVFPAGDIPVLQKYLGQLTHNEALRKDMGLTSLRMIDHWGFREAIGGIKNALQNVSAKTGIVVVDPGSQHLYQSAIAFTKAGMLIRYLTGIYYDETRIPYTLLRYFPARIRFKLQSELRRRSRKGLAPDDVKTFGIYEWILVLIRRIPVVKQAAFRIMQKRNRYFAKKAGQYAIKNRAAGIFCPLNAAEEAFVTAKKNNIFCILDQFIGHPRMLDAMLTEEIKKHPRLAAVTRERIPADVLQRIDREIAGADLLITGSSFAEKTLIDRGVPAEKITVVPYGVDTAKFRPGNPREKNKTFDLIFVGNISVRKGAEYLLQAMKALSSYDIRLTMAGPVEDAYFLKQYGKYFTWKKSVPHAELPALLAAHDAFILPSLFEGSALSVYEAMAIGLPVIVTPETGSVARDGEDGYLIPSRDITAIQNAVTELYKNREGAAVMGKSARLRARQYTWDAYHKKLAEIVKKRISER